MSRKRKPSAEAANLTQNQILKELKKAFSLDNSVINILKKLYSPTAIKKSFNAGKTATQKMVNQAKEAVKTGKPGTSRAKVVRASIAKPAVAKPKGMSDRKNVATTSITVQSMVSPKSKPSVPAKKGKSSVKPTSKPKLYNLASGKKGTAAQRLAEIDREKAREKVDKLVKKLVKSTKQKKKTKK